MLFTKFLVIFVIIITSPFSFKITSALPLQFEIRFLINLSSTRNGQIFSQIGHFNGLFKSRNTFKSKHSICEQNSPLTGFSINLPLIGQVNLTTVCTRELSFIRSAIISFDVFALIEKLSLMFYRILFSIVLLFNYDLL